MEWASFPLPNSWIIHTILRRYCFMKPVNSQPLSDASLATHGSKATTFRTTATDIIHIYSICRGFKADWNNNYLFIVGDTPKMHMLFVATLLVSFMSKTYWDEEKKFWDPQMVTMSICQSCCLYARLSYFLMGFIRIVNLSEIQLSLKALLFLLITSMATEKKNTKDAKMTWKIPFFVVTITHYIKRTKNVLRVWDQRHINQWPLSVRLFGCL